MHHVRLIAIIATAVIAASAVGEEEVPLRSAPNSLPPEVEPVLAQGEFELLSLYPYVLTDRQRRRLQGRLFHGYKVLGRVKIQKGPQRDEMLRALHQAVANSRGLYIYCFDPRHGIRASAGPRTVDLVICFECERIEIYSPEKSLANTDATAKPILDAALKRAGLPLSTR